MIDFQKCDGKVPVIIQCERTMRVRMQTWMDEPLLEKNLENRGRAHFEGDGEEDGSLGATLLDCDNDAVLVMLRYHGAEAIFGRNYSSFNRTPVEFRSTEELLPVTVQQAGTCEVLMHAYMNLAAFERTEETGFAHFWSRSRRSLWKKGESSGNTQKVHTVLFDPEARNMLLLVDQSGAACHKGYRSCFFRRQYKHGEWQVAALQLFDPEQVYADKKGKSSE